jgi:hypothetical protein
MSDDRPIAQYTREEYDVLCKRLQNASDTLRSGNSLLQSVARAYYVVYVVGSYAAGTQGVKVTHRRAGELVTEQDFSHYEFVDVVWALYTGNKRGKVSDPGASPGIRSAHYEEREAYRNANALFQARIEADYGPSTSAEPYTAAEVDRLLETAKYLVEDLERLI